MAGTTATALAIAGIAAGLTGAGVTAYEGVANRNASADASAANKEALKKAEQAAANQANLTKQQAVLGAQGQSQQQTGGSLTDDGTSALTALLAGYPGYQAGSSSGSGSGSGTSTGQGIGSSGVDGSGDSTGGTGGSGTGSPDIAALLSKLRSSGTGGLGGGLGSGSSISGGNWQSQPSTPQSNFQLANPVI